MGTDIDIRLYVSNCGWDLKETGCSPILPRRSHVVISIYKLLWKVGTRDHNSAPRNQGADTKCQNPNLSVCSPARRLHILAHDQKVARLQPSITSKSPDRHCTGSFERTTELQYQNACFLTLAVSISRPQFTRPGDWRSDQSRRVAAI